jgi:hypothetical protein
VAKSFDEEEYNRKIAVCDEVYDNYARDWYRRNGYR